MSGATFNSYNSPASDSSALKPMKVGGQNISSDTSYQSGKSWAEELAAYNAQFKPLQPERVSLDKSEGSFQPMKQSLDSDAAYTTDKSVDRSYKVLHFTPREETSREETKSPMEALGRKSHSPSEMRASELSQYPLSSETSPQSQRSRSPGSQRGGLGKVSPNLQATIDTEMQQSLASTMTESIQSCASSYMDIKGDNGGPLGSREFDFIGRTRLPQIRSEQIEPSVNIAADTSQQNTTPQGTSFSGALEFTSTPNVKGSQMKNMRLSEISQFTISPEESKVQAGSANIPQSYGGHFSHFKPSDDSFGRVSNQQQAFTKISGPNFLSHVSEEAESMESGKSLLSGTKDLTKMREDSSLSQFSITDPSSTELSLTQITLEQMATPDRSKQEMASLSQFTAKSSPELSGKDNSLSGKDSSLSGKDNSSLSQYSFDSSHNIKLSDTNNSNNVGLSALSYGESQMEDEEDEDDGYVEKKFANLDQLIKESKDLITKHKALIDKNKMFDGGSRESPPPPPLPQSNPPRLLATPTEEGPPSTQGGSMMDYSDDHVSGMTNPSRYSDDRVSGMTDPSHMFELDQVSVFIQL